MPSQVHPTVFYPAPRETWALRPSQQQLGQQEPLL